METEFLMPRLDNYYSDYLQLEIILSKKAIYRGIYSYETDPFGNVTSQTFAINVSCLHNKPKKWKGFVKEFSDVWLHEWLHLVGLSDEGIREAKKLGFPTA